MKHFVRALAILLMVISGCDKLSVNERRGASTIACEVNGQQVVFKNAGAGGDLVAFRFVDCPGCDSTLSITGMKYGDPNTTLTVGMAYTKHRQKYRISNQAGAYLHISNDGSNEKYSARINDTGFVYIHYFDGKKLEGSFAFNAFDTVIQKEVKVTGGSFHILQE